MHVFPAHINTRLCFSHEDEEQCEVERVWRDMCRVWRDMCSVEGHV